MEIINDEKIVVLKDGVEKEYDLLFSFDVEDNNKGYVCYTDHGLNDKNEENIFVSSYDLDKGPVSFNEITDDEKSMVDDMIKDIMNNLNWGDSNELRNK